MINQDIINVLENSDSEVLFYAEKFGKYIDEISKKLPNNDCHKMAIIIWQYLSLSLSLPDHVF